MGITKFYLPYKFSRYILSKDPFIDFRYYFPKGIKIYRAADTVEKIPKPRPDCDNINRKGSYFSVYSSYLSRVLTIEKERDLYLCTYELIRPVPVILGKENYIKNVSPTPNSFDLISPGVIEGINYKPRKLSEEVELFLSQKFLKRKYIKFVKYEKITLSDALKNYAC